MEQENRRRRLQEAVDADPENSSHHFNLGFFLWEKCESSKECKEKAVEHFVISARLNPNNGAAFRLLGHYYSRVSVDWQRAAKCYQKAVTLNPEDFESGEALCDRLDKEGKESLEVAICRETSKKSPRAFWAFRRLGYMLVYQKNWSEAVQSLQHAIRGYPSCADLWEALGLAYQRLGMFTAALKSYGRAIELEKTRVFALTESGNVHLMLGSFKNGVEQFRQALEIAPLNVAALYGLACGLLGLSRDAVNSGAFCWASSVLEEASIVAKASSGLAGNNSSIWKLLGDTQLAYSKCFPWVNEGNFETDVESFRNSILGWKKKCLMAAHSASHSYQKALHLTPWEANIYTDIALSLDLISSLEERSTDVEEWQLSEKMCLGGLILEAGNSDFWVALGCLSNHNSLKQHALIRSLHLDVSLAMAWAYLGKLYRQEGEELLARQAFDHARSIDPSLALPWAGMAVDTREGKQDEAYESCMRAVQILPLPEFQLGLGKLSIFSGRLLNPQVFGALRQALLRAPHYPESHNLTGLVYEARADFQSAITAYRQAIYVITWFGGKEQTSCIHASVNLARSLCRAGYAVEAVHECEELQKKGLLDDKGMHIYAVALWKLGRAEQSLSIARTLAKSISTMDRGSGLAVVAFICKLLYHISGLDSAASSIMKIPGNMKQSLKISSILSVVVALHQKSQFQSFLPGDLSFLSTPAEVVKMHSLVAVLRLLTNGSENCLGIQSSTNYLRKILHMYPNSTLIRNQLSSLLLCSGEWKSSHYATRCVIIEHPEHPVTKYGKSGFEIIGSAAVACYASCTTKLKSSFPACMDHQMQRTGVVQQLQKWLRQEPWHHKARYLLVLCYLQKAREEKYPPHLCVTLKRLLVTALSDEVYSSKDLHCNYQKFQLLLSTSEICLQEGDHVGCMSHAATASQLPVPSNVLFFAHLQLCRVYAVQKDFQNLKDGYLKCLDLGTDYCMGWISLKYIECRNKLQGTISAADLGFENSLKAKGSARNKWMALYNFVAAHSFLWDQNFLEAGQFLAHVCSLGVDESCLYLVYGAICMELARQRSSSEFLLHAVGSLRKAQEFSFVRLPIASALLAQAEASQGARAKWEHCLQDEWLSWPAAMKPAEVYFQMHLIAKQKQAASDVNPAMQTSESPRKWILRAIHLNPSCTRYWKVLQKVRE